MSSIDRSAPLGTEAHPIILRVPSLEQWMERRKWNRDFRRFLQKEDKEMAQETA